MGRLQGRELLTIRYMSGGKHSDSGSGKDFRVHSSNPSRAKTNRTWARASTQFICRKINELHMILDADKKKKK